MRLGLQTYTTGTNTRIAFLVIDEDGHEVCSDTIEEGREEDLVLPVLLARFRGMPFIVLASEDRISYRRHIGPAHLILRLKPAVYGHGRKQRGPYPISLASARRALKHMKLQDLQPGGVFEVETEIENRPPRALLTSSMGCIPMIQDVVDTRPTRKRIPNKNR